MREFHITDLPQDRIFVLLNEEYHRDLFHMLKWDYGFKKLNELFDNKLNWNTYQSWQQRELKIGNRVKKRYIPLWFICELTKILEIKIADVEKNIIAYQGPSTSNPIVNPNLPFVEDKRLLKILAHLIGDGSVGGGFGSKLPKGKQHSEYRNFAPELLDQFEDDLQVFGEVKTTKNYAHGHVIIPNVIGYILQHIYKIKFDSFNSTVPKDLYALPKELIGSFIRAFADDEAHVYDNHIDFYSANKVLMTQLMSLFNCTFPEIELSELKVNTSVGRNPKYYFYVLSQSRESYYTLIGFDSKEKNKSMVFNLKRGSSCRSRAPGKTKSDIITNLKEKQLTAKELSRIIGISHGNILRMLRNMHNVEIIGRREHGTNIWGLANLK